MAVDTPDRQQKTFVTEAFEGQFCIVAPVFFMDLVKATLNGWQFAEQSCVSPKDIVVSYQDEVFHIDATILDEPKVVEDLLDALNEFFLCLSYLLANKNPALKLLHCASYVDANQNVILLGEKRSGKSEQILAKAMAGHKIYADDLLLWHPEKGEFMALGLPLRLRRSAVSLLKDASIKDRFLIGKHILYSHKKYFNRAALGEQFSLDQIKVMNQDFEPVKISIYQFLERLEQSLISDNFLSYKKPL